MKASRINAQKGAVLVICMIVLLMLTIIGVSGARNIILQEKMTFASKDAQLALQVAEGAVRAAEADIDALNTINGFTLAGTGGYYSLGDAPSDIYDPDNWTDTLTQTVTLEMDGKEFTGRYFIELAGELAPAAVAGNVEQFGTNNVIPESGTIRVFRIVALGQGMSSTQRVIVTHHGKLL